MQITKPLIGAAILLLGFTGLASNGAAPVQDSELKLSVLELKASIVAYNDFAKRISVRTDGPSELVAHVSNVDNYSVVVSEDTAHFVVVFLPSPFMGQMLKGSGARYTISKTSFQIEDVVRFK